MVWQVVQEYGTSVNLEPSPMHILYGHTECVTSVDISIELDIIVSASLDGTVNVHTVRKGHFVKTLWFPSEINHLFNNLTLKISNQRHILIYTSAHLQNSNKDLEFQVKFNLNLIYN